MWCAVVCRTVVCRVVVWCVEEKVVQGGKVVSWLKLCCGSVCMPVQCDAEMGVVCCGVLWCFVPGRACRAGCAVQCCAVQYCAVQGCAVQSPA
eukprot:m.110725 g.110725  ORF g.110725 m.110725 type:complete len:93 (+) comp16072_c1_seq1:125-403(+)